MKSRSEFWLTLHRLAHDLEIEGDTDESRAKSICDVLGSLSASTRDVYLSDLEFAQNLLFKVAATCKEQKT
jgi:hypothetical protein